MPGRSIRSIPKAARSYAPSNPWADGDLWHGTWEGGDSDLRRIDPETGEVLERIDMLSGTMVFGLEYGGNRFLCGGDSGTVSAVRRPDKS